MVGTFFSRGISSFAIFCYIPLLIEIVEKSEFGKVSMFISLTSLFAALDVGIANSVRNDITRYMSTNRSLRLSFLIGNAYSILLKISLCVVILISAIYAAFLLTGQQDKLSSVEIAQTVTCIFLAISFVLLNSTSGFWNGTHEQHINSYFRAGSNIIFLISLIVINFSEELISCRSFFCVYTLYLLVLNLSLLASTLFFFKSYPNLLPRTLKNVRNSNLFLRGLKFFGIQISAIVLLSTDKLFVAILFDYDVVADYEIIYRLLSLPYILHAMIVAPLWAEFNQLSSNKQVFRIYHIVIKQLLPLLICAVFCLVIMLNIKFIIQLWVGSGINLHGSLPEWTSILLVLMMWNNLFSMYLNGIERLQVISILWMISLLANPILNFTFVKIFGLGPEGVSIATILCLFPIALVGPTSLLKDAKLGKHSLR